MRPVADDPGWEARMAQRAKERAAVREAVEVAEFAASLPRGEDFEDAWSRRLYPSDAWSGMLLLGGFELGQAD